MASVGFCSFAPCLLFSCERPLALPETDGRPSYTLLSSEPTFNLQIQRSSAHRFNSSIYTSRLRPSPPTSTANEQYTSRTHVISSAFRFESARSVQVLLRMRLEVLVLPRAGGEQGPTLICRLERGVTLLSVELLSADCIHSIAKTRPAGNMHLSMPRVGLIICKHASIMLVYACQPAWCVTSGPRLNQLSVAALHCTPAGCYPLPWGASFERTWGPSPPLQKSRRFRYIYVARQSKGYIVEPLYSRDPSLCGEMAFPADTSCPHNSRDVYTPLGRPSCLWRTCWSDLSFSLGTRRPENIQPPSFVAFHIRISRCPSLFTDRDLNLAITLEFRNNNASGQFDGFQ